MIEIDVVIKMGEECEKRMSINQAMDLYGELGKLFGHQQTLTYSPGNREAYPHRQVSSAQKSNMDENKREPSKTGGCGCGKKKEAGPGPGAKRVEEVKAARAARVGRPKKRIETEEKEK